MSRPKVMDTIVKLAGAIDPSLEKSINKTTKALGGIDLKAAAIGATVAAAAVVAVKALADCTKSARAFEKQMSNVGTLLDGDVNKRLSEMSTELLQVSAATGVATSDLTDGLYQVVSAFGDSAEASKQLEIAAKAAKAGNATTTDSINLLSAVTKGYGDTSAEAQQKAADLAFQTVKLGQTSFPELAASMGKVIPLAKTMGVSQEELFGAMATLTGVTGGTAEVTTQLRGAIQGFLQPSKQMTEAMKALGYADGKAMLEANGLQGSLDLLKKQVKNNEIAFAGLFGSVEAKNAVLALAGAQADNFTAKTKAMFDATGAANKAFLAQIDNVDDLNAMVQNCGEVFKIMVGNIILPYLKEFYSAVLPMVQNVLAGMPPVLDAIANGVRITISIARALTPIIAGVTAGFIAYKISLIATSIAQKGLTVSMIAQNAITAISTGLMTGLTAVTTAFGAVMAFITSPIGLVVLAIGALVAAGVALWMNWDKIVNFCQSVLAPALQNTWEGIKNGVASFINWIVEAWGRLTEILLAPFNALKNAASSLKAFVSGNNTTKGQGLPAFANGGFTDGVSIAGEKGTEAVISFNSAYRDRNLSIWEKAGEMLGVSDSSSVTIDIGGVTFAPVLQMKDNADSKDIMQKLQEHESEFTDLLVNALKRHNAKAFG